MLAELKDCVFRENIELVKQGVVKYTWGNVSAIDRASGLMVIKPSGVSYEAMRPQDMVVVDVETGKVVEGDLNPSSDTPTHLELYRCFEGIGGVTHTHSTFAVAFAQAGLDVDALGTTHADTFYGAVPCTRQLSEDEVKSAYELNTGKVIVEEFVRRGIDPLAVPGVVVRGHGPFAWGSDAGKSVYNAVVLEEVAKMAFLTVSLDEQATLPQYILDKHYYRKHGPGAYYGQN